MLVLLFMAVSLSFPAAVHSYAICYKELGCFTDDRVVSDTAWYDIVSKMIGVSFPASPDNLTIEFRLLTRETTVMENQDRGELINITDSESLAMSTLNGDRPTKVIIHGLREDCRSDSWMFAMAKSLLAVGDYNVFVVDWSSGSNTMSVFLNSRVVGAVVWRMIVTLENASGINPLDIHIIGHSLGADIAGHVGEKLFWENSSQIGRITGLDPVFLYHILSDPKCRLDPSDAVFVDVIYSGGVPIMTDIKMSHPSGHMNIYPNGGHSQPGCSLVSTLISSVSSPVFGGLHDYFTCNHKRSREIFQDSLDSTCPYQVYECSTWAEFEKGDCIPCLGGLCKRLGLTATSNLSLEDTKNVARYYLKTADKAPYCLYHYKVAVMVENGSECPFGSLHMRLHGEFANIDAFLMAKGKDLLHQGNLTKVVTSPTPLGNVSLVELNYSKQPFDFRSPFCHENRTLVVGNVTVVFGENSHRHHVIVDDYLNIDLYSIRVIISDYVNKVERS